MKQTCQSCKFFEQGICRRYPPVLVPYPNDNQHPVIYWPQSNWPETSALSWCGEYAEKGAGNV